MIHLVMRGDPGGCDLVRAYARQESAHFDAEVRNLLPEPRTTYYAISMQVDGSDNQEGIEFDEGLPTYPHAEVFLVVEVDNPELPGRLMVAAFSDRSDAEEIAERQNLYATNSGSHEVVACEVDLSPVGFPG